MSFIHENIKIIVAALISLAVIIFTAVALSLAYGGETVRTVRVTDIDGSAVIIRDSQQTYAAKRTVLKSGDVINTDEKSTVRVCVDTDKFISIEPSSSVYVYYTEISGKGEISVNVVFGAVTCQLNNKLGKNETFVVKTPNAAINVRGTVFRTEFDFKESYMGYSNVMLTHVQNFDGMVTTQLYDTYGEKVDEPMLLSEKASAELISANSLAQYGYLNYDIDLQALDELTLKELVRISGEKNIAYTLDELNNALKAVKQIKSEAAVTTVPETETEDKSEQSEQQTTAVRETTKPITEITEQTTAESETSYDTLRTTLQTYMYTTFAGPKWWEITNENPDPNDDNFDDGGVFDVN